MSEVVLQRIFCDLEVTIRLAEGQTVGDVFIETPGGRLVRHALDLEQSLSAGIPVPDALESSLDAVCVGISAMVLSHA